MKNKLFSIFLMLFLVSIFYLPNTFAQDFSYTILEGHTDSINSVAFSPDGQVLASGSDDNMIRLWEVNTGTHLRTLEGHTRSVNSVSFSPDGQVLASGSWDNTIRLWDANTGAHLRTLEGQTQSVNNVSFSPDGQMIANGGFVDTIELWDVETGSRIRTFTGNDRSIASIAFSPDGQRLASVSYGWNRLTDNEIRLWEVNTGRSIRTLRPSVIQYGGWQYVSSVAFSPDGRMFASGMGKGKWPAYSGGIALWDANTGAHLRTLKGHEYYVNSVSFSPDGQVLASGSDDNTIRLWDANTGAHLRTLEGHRRDVHSVVFSPDGRTLASSDTDITIRLWNLSTRVSITPNIMASPAIGEQFSVNVDMIEGTNVGGYQFSMVYDKTALRYVESVNGDYLPAGAFFLPHALEGNRVMIGATSLAGVANGDGTLATLTFEVVDVKESTLSLSDVIFTDSEGEHLPLLKSSSRIHRPAAVSSFAIISITPSPVVSAAVGEQITFSIDIAGGENVKGYELILLFDKTALRPVWAAKGNYLDNASFSAPVVRRDPDEWVVMVQVTSLSGVGNGDGTLVTVRFEVLEPEATETPTVNTSNVSISRVVLTGRDGLTYIPIYKDAHVQVQIAAPIFGDVNSDGVVNILDLVRVAASFGKKVPRASVLVDGKPVLADADPADVNGDGIINIVDLVKIAGVIGGGAAAPSVLYSDLEAAPTRATVQKWLSQAHQFNLTDTTSQQGVVFLEQLLAALTPKETALLPNYPNPFNPETWIPYQLSEDSSVSVSIYDMTGTLVRNLSLGFQSAGFYNSRARAAYWDGRNSVGERVASGIYFYQLTTPSFNQTRRLVIVK